MEILVEKAVKEDCAAIMQLVHELAVYEKAPDEVTVSMEHFIESGFGEKKDATREAELRRQLADRLRAMPGVVVVSQAHQQPQQIFEARY